MKELFREVLDLQPFWTATNSDEMRRRGVMVRTEVPARLRRFGAELAAALGVPEPELKIEGRDGTGLKTEIPWVRVAAAGRSPSATTGWYVVYLFDREGEWVHLSLNQGTTQWTGSDFVPRAHLELAARVEWARPFLAARVANRQGLARSIRLRGNKSKLGAGYEAGNVYAIGYHRDDLPGETVLRSDLAFMLGLLSEVYLAEDEAGFVPGDVAPEIQEIQDVAAIVAGRRSRRGRGQGFRQSADERRLIEQHSVQIATSHYEAEGWTVKDVGATNPYDLHATRGDERRFIEVKGTVSAGDQVVLTRAEVERQREFYPENALVLVHSIQLYRDGGVLSATGGELEIYSPWHIADENLTVVSYVYRV